MRKKDVINGALAIAREVFRWRDIQFEISAWVWILWLMLWSFQLSYLMKTKPWSKRWLFFAAVFSCNHASNHIQEDSIFWTCTFDVLIYCWISYTIASWNKLSSESSCFRGSTQELALTRWITNNFNHEKTLTLPLSWGGGACFHNSKMHCALKAWHDVTTSVTLPLLTRNKQPTWTNLVNTFPYIRFTKRKKQTTTIKSSQFNVT